MAHADPQHEASVAFALSYLGVHVHGAAPLQVGQRRRDLLLDLRLARATFGSLPVHRKWLWRSSRSGAGGSYQD